MTMAYLHCDNGFTCSTSLLLQTKEGHSPRSPASTSPESSTYFHNLLFFAPLVKMTIRQCSAKGSVVCKFVSHVFVNSFPRNPDRHQRQVLTHVPCFATEILYGAESHLVGVHPTTPCKVTQFTFPKTNGVPVVS